MKIVIEFNDKIDFNNKERLKNLISREDFNVRLKAVIDNDNEEGLNVHNTFGQWIYTITLDKD